MAEGKNHNRGLSWGILSWTSYAKRPHERVAAVAYVVLAHVILAIILIALSLLLRVLVAAFDTGNLDPIKSADDFNKILLGLGGLIGAVTAVPFLVWRTMIAQRQNTIAEENLHSTTMAKAIEQLGAMKEEKVTRGRAIPDETLAPETVTNSKPNIEVRLGAIYLLEKLAREHEQLHWPIMEILCAYIRENAGPPQPPPPEVKDPYPALFKWTYEQRRSKLARKQVLSPPRVDVQAALTVIGRRTPNQLVWEAAFRSSSTSERAYRLDLSRCHLAYAQFDGLDFNHALFDESCLEGCSFRKSKLEGASLYLAHLEIAKISKANLQRANLSKAYLQGADFYAARLEGANLSEAYAEGAYLSDANLDGANLAHARLEGAYLSKAHLKGTSIQGAYLVGTIFDDAHLDDTLIDNTNLLAVFGFTSEMAASAWGNAATLLPEGMERPLNERWALEDEFDLERHIRWYKRSFHWYILGKERAERDHSSS
jgi:uncharacterized protein YjbI with pentapeptide repeats